MAHPHHLASRDSSGGETLEATERDAPSPDDLAHDVKSGTYRANEVKETPWSGQFFGQTEALVKARKIYFEVLAQRTALIILVMFGVFSIYWGALCKVPARQVEGWLVDFDEGSIGRSVINDLQGLSSSALKWRVQPASMFPNEREDLSQAILNEHCWVAISVNAGTSQSLIEALGKSLDDGYNASTAITVFGIEARHENTFRTLIRPTVDTWIQRVTYNYAIKHIQDLSNANSSLTVASIPPSLLARPIYYTFVNLRPFDVPVASAATFVGLIYLLILAFFVVNSAVLARDTAKLDSKLTLSSLVRVKIVTAMTIYLLLSCFYALLNRAFQLPMDRKFGNAGFFVFWMISWFGMMATGLALESMITLLTAKYIPMFLLLWIISNVSICAWPVELLPKVYSYGYAAPFYQISRTVRSTVFRTRNEVGLNFGILIVWILISCTTLSIFQWYRRRNEINAWKAQQHNEKLES